MNYNYDAENITFDVTICYAQQCNGYRYVFHDSVQLKDLDFTRRALITGDYKKDIEVAYKQVYSNLYRKYGKLRQGLELTVVNNEVLYNTLMNGSINFRYEKTLYSPEDTDYIDGKFGDPYIINICSMDNKRPAESILNFFKTSTEH